MRSQTRFPEGSRQHHEAAVDPYGGFVRNAFHDQLGALTQTLGQMCGLVGAAMKRDQALLQADLLLAEHMITDTTIWY